MMKNWRFISLSLLLVIGCNHKDTNVPVVGFVDAFEDNTIGQAKTGFIDALEQAQNHLSQCSGQYSYTHSDSQLFYCTRGLTHSHEPIFVYDYRCTEHQDYPHIYDGLSLTRIDESQ